VNALARDLRVALDPALLAEDIGMDPDPWQDDAMGDPHPRQLYNCHRQAGKSTVAGVVGVHTAIYEPGSLIPIFSPSMRQSGELFKKMLAVYQRFGKPVIAEAENALSLTLENGSRILSLPGLEGTVRGFSGARLIIIDEASRVADALITAVRPMLAVTGGRLIAMSTPNGKRGWWYQAWASEGPFPGGVSNVKGRTWKRVLVTADQCPRITKAFLAEEHLALGDRLYRQEYFGEFLETVEQVFGADSITSAFSRGVEPLAI
jgi:hypothetical protein